MDSDKALGPNNPEYYRTAADYDGVVLKSRQLLSGLTTINLRKWYLECCFEFFLKKAKDFCLAERCEISASSSAAHRSKIIKLARRLTSRLYVARKMRKIQVELDNICELVINKLEGSNNNGYKRAIDKSLYLAERLKWSTKHVLYEAKTLEQARLGSTHFGLTKFEPTEEASKYCAWQLGFSMAHAHHFRQLLLQFDQSIQQTTEAVTLTSQSTIATLSPSVQPADVRALLKEMGMGSVYNTPGEWAAALRALFVADLLKGNGREIARWAIGEQYVKQRSFETIRKAWEGDGLSQAEQFRNNEQARVFRMVLNSARKLMKSSMLGGD